jgi:hypothetical protein
MGKQDQKSKGHKVCSQTRKMKHLWLRFGNVRMWTFNHLASAQNECSKIDIDHAHPFQEWNSMELLVVLVQVLTSKTKYSTC